MGSICKKAVNSASHVQLLQSKGHCGASVQGTTPVYNPPDLSESIKELNKKPAGLQIVDMGLYSRLEGVHKQMSLSNEPCTPDKDGV